MEIGTIIAIIAVLLFYLRLIILQRQRVKKSRSGQSGTGRKGAKQPTQALTWITVQNWYLVGISILLMVGGAVLSTSVLGPTFRPWWWIPVCIGILLMAMGLG